MVDWQPTWSTGAGGRGVLDDWNSLKASGSTFKFGDNEVIRADNSSRDEDGSHIRNMIKVVFKRFGDYLLKDAEALADDLFKEVNWKFLDAAQERVAARGLDIKPTAAEVMRIAFTDNHLDSRTPGAGRSPFRDILVQYTGGIEPPSSTTQPQRRQAAQPRRGKSPNRFTGALFAPVFTDNEFMLVNHWDQYCHANRENDKAYTRTSPVHTAVCDLVSDCPYLLRKPWSLMFISLFLDADEIRQIMERSDMEFTLQEKTKRSRGWENEAWN